MDISHYGNVGESLLLLDAVVFRIRWHSKLRSAMPGISPCSRLSDISISNASAVPYVRSPKVTRSSRSVRLRCLTVLLL